MSVRFLERIGLLRPRSKVEKIYGDEERLRQLTADHLKGRIGLGTYITETDKLPKLNLRQLAQGLKFKG